MNLQIELHFREESCIKLCMYKGGPKYNGNVNVAREREVVVRCAARCCESTQYSSSLRQSRLTVIVVVAFFVSAC
jgi:hypothetical protein